VVSSSQVEKTLEDDTTTLSQVSGTNHPMMWHHIPEKWREFNCLKTSNVENNYVQTVS
jgi:hypothetical protein